MEGLETEDSLSGALKGRLTWTANKQHYVLNGLLPFLIPKGRQPAFYLLSSFKNTLAIYFIQRKLRL